MTEQEKALYDRIYQTVDKFESVFYQAVEGKMDMMQAVKLKNEFALLGNEVMVELIRLQDKATHGRGDHAEK